MDEYVGILEPVIDYFGVGFSTFTLLFSMIFIAVVWLVTYMHFGSPRLSAFISLGTMLIVTMLGMIPIWITFIYGTMVVGSLFFFTGDSESQEIAQARNTWAAYGERLKEAYAAKFGGRNPGFEDEVDKRIAVMQNLKKGFTHTIARDWLKRTENFTEAKLEKEA